MNPGLCFISLFESMNTLTACLWITGLILFCVEFFQPMHGVAYSLGLGLIGAAFVTRMIYGSAGEAFVFVLITCVVLFCVHIIALITQKRDWLRVSRIEKTGERTRRYGKLIDSIGVAITPIDLTGSVNINDVNLVVYSDTPIEQGEKVRIVKIAVDKIIVERASASSDESDEPVENK